MTRARTNRGRPRQGAGLGLAALAACASAALLTAPAATPAPATTASPWQLFPGARMDVGRPVLALGWAANRIWVLTPYRDVPILRSARPAGGKLAAFVETRVPDDAATYFPIVDGELVLDSVPGREGNFTVPLLASGRLGALEPVADDLVALARKVAPKLETVGILDGASVGDRIVWALRGSEKARGIGGAPQFLLACCSESGAAVDLTRFVSRRDVFLFHRVGVDDRGRIWLAWLDNRSYSAAVRGVPRILELDPRTLAPRSPARALPGVIADRIELACAASCRLVVQSAGGDIVSWAPGERSPTRVASHWERGKWGDGPAFLLAATHRSGRLVVAYHGSWGKTIYADASVRDEIRVARGDARGAGSRVVGAIPVANTWPPGKARSSTASPIVHGTFAPNGLVAVETFMYTRGSSSPVAAAFVPLR